MDYILDSVFEVFLYFRLGKSKEGDHHVLYYSSDIESSGVLKIRDLPEQQSGTKRIVLVSDTHDRYRGLNLPPGDLFIHAGDIFMTGRMLSLSKGKSKLADFNNWLGTLNFKEKIVIAGNHDKPIELLGVEGAQGVLSNATYLQNQTLEVDSVTILGSPISSGHSGNDSFQSESFAEDTKEIIRSHAFARKKGGSAKRVDVLVTHGPNFDIASEVQPQLHVWGHAHHYHGLHRPGEELWGHTFSCLSVNASIMTTRYCPDNLPVVVDFRF